MASHFGLACHWGLLMCGRKVKLLVGVSQPKKNPERSTQQILLR